MTDRSAFTKKPMTWLTATTCVLMAACSGRASSIGVTTINISDAILQPHVKRFGINLGNPAFYGSNQLLKNLLYRNPGFEGLIYQSTIRCASGTASSCNDDDFWSGWPAGFWNDATYEFIWGAAKGATGTVMSSTAANGSTAGAVFQFSSNGTPPATGDYMIVRKTLPGSADAGWWMSASGGGSYSTEFSDLPPNSPGKQSLRLTANSGQSVTTSAYFDSQGGQNFILLNGTYTLKFSAKAASGTGGLTIQIGRVGGQNYVSQTQALTSSWADYQVRFTANETQVTPVASGQVSITYYGSGSVLLDDVSLVQTNGDPTNTTAFLDAVVNALKEYNPGILRYWAGQLGDTIDNLTAPVGARQRAGYSAFGTGQDDQQMGLHEFLQLSQAVGAEPWFVLPITISTSEASWLIDYLAGPTTTVGGARRAARGQSQPWTAVFPQIHLEFGNEAWNNIFKGGSIEESQPYGNRAQEIFAAMRSNPYFFEANTITALSTRVLSPPSRGTFDLVIGGQAAYPARNAGIQSACNNNDSFATAPYQQMQVDSYSSPQQLWGPAFAEAEMDVTTGHSSQSAPLIANAAAGRTVRESVYEINFHTTAGAIDQATLDAFTPALGAGLSVADHMLMLLKRFGMRDQMLFALPQYSFQRPDGKTLRLWGSVVDMGVTDLRRPQFLALQMVNQAVVGDMLVTTHAGADPTWNQPLMNGVGLSNAHSLHSYAFSDGATHTIVLLNLSLTSSQPVTFTGLAPTGNVTINQLTSASPSDTNESGPVVVPHSALLSNFVPTSALSLPPYSLTVLSWSTGGVRRQMTSH